MTESRTNSEKISNTLDKSELAKEKKMLERILAKDPDNYWAISNYAIIHYEIKNYKEALKFSKKAMQHGKRDPLILNYHAVILKANNNIKKAIEIWESLLERDIYLIAFKDCTEGLKWAKSLLNDIRYNLSLAYFEVNDFKQARRLIRDHLKYRKQGQFSLYSKKDAIRMLEKLS